MAKWLGLGLSLLIALAWAVSFSPFVLVDGSCVLEGGELSQRWAPDDLGCRVVGPAGRTPATDDISLPLLPVLIITAVATAILFWRDRRPIPPHCCSTCGYNLTGNTSNVCPECGTRR